MAEEGSTAVVAVAGTAAADGATAVIIPYVAVTAGAAAIGATPATAGASQLASTGDLSGAVSADIRTAATVGLLPIIRIITHTRIPILTMSQLLRRAT